MHKVPLLTEMNALWSTEIMSPVRNHESCLGQRNPDKETRKGEGCGQALPLLSQRMKA